MYDQDFRTSSFSPRDDRQWQLLYDFLQVRLLVGPPRRFTYLRTLARTRHTTRTVYPPGWRY